MLIVQNSIVSDDVVECRFCCCLEQCKGQCCVEGDFGAPLTDEEVDTLSRILPVVEPYMTHAGLEAVRQQGVSVLDNAAEPCTPLVNNRECAYVSWSDDGIALCAIEQACRDGKTDFLKPISCHLYPIRVDDYGEFTAVNYHRWEVCHPQGMNCGREYTAASTDEAMLPQPLYRYLREPLIRRFGADWYAELEAAAKEKDSTKGHQ